MFHFFADSQKRISALTVSMENAALRYSSALAMVFAKSAMVASMKKTARERLVHLPTESIVLVGKESNHQSNGCFTHQAALGKVKYHERSGRQKKVVEPALTADKVHVGNGTQVSFIFDTNAFMAQI